ncbi:hypothetical protein B0H19DRAFT_1264925 [Mycena capillaripes]|nr:hypothetical protein B0H19DRAFT_1264925 [Mycena capillaripes]
MSSTTGDSRRRQRDEDGDGSSEERPQQRQKTEDQTLVEEDYAEPLVKDLEFYREDGDCIFRVENTLFKVHRHLLNYPLSAFHGLFSLPRGAENKCEGEDDITPIRLFGDTIEQFRSFFGYAYSSPLDLQYSRISSDAIYKLIYTLKFAHKYRLESFETWAAEAITHVCDQAQGQLLNTCTPELYVALLEVDLLFPLSGVKASIRKRWVDRLRKRGPQLKLIQALDAADRLRFRALQGDVYYLQLQKLDVQALDIAAAHAAPPLPTELSDVHKLRLLTGYRSLILSWDRMAATPLALVGTCTEDFMDHLDSCIPQWNTMWTEGVNAISTSSVTPIRRGDLVASLKTLRAYLVARDNGGCAMVTQAVKEGLPHLITTIETSIPDHFLGPDPEAPATQ